MTELKAEPIIHAQSDLGEGAIWDQNAQRLYWVDIDRFQIHIFDPQSGADKTIQLDSHVGTVVKRSKQDGFVAALPAKFVYVDMDGNVTALAEVDEEKGNAKVRLNDGKCDPAGRLWCGSMAFDFAKGAGHLWMMDEQLKVHKKLSDVTISNGIVWSLDARTMYYIDTGNNCVDAFDYVLETGEISNRRTVVTNAWGGYFDGMTIDADGMLYIAIWNGAAVFKFDPKSGKRLATIRVPGAKNITSCAFGGDKLQDLFITSSSNGTDRKTHQNAGDLFRITLSDTCGVPAYEFAS